VNFEPSTRILFFTGKGGVGKTSLASATALKMARAGRRVLLVSTDPASNLDEVLGVRLSGSPTAIPNADGLFALNIDPEAAAKAYRERVIGPYRGVLPDAALNSMEEGLSGACTVEIAAFDEFTKLLGDPQATAGFDHIIFDTAPTGHTLRLLKLPAAWTGFIATNTTGTSCLGPLSGLETQKGLYESSLAALTDPAATTIVLVSRPDRASLAEAERSRAELAEMGIGNQVLFLNGVFRAQVRTDSDARALEERGQEALDHMPSELAKLPRSEFPLLPYAPMGVAGLGAMFGDSTHAPLTRFECTDAIDPGLSLGALVDRLEQAGRGVIMTMGKGGVGKTTIASAIAVELAARGHSVHLSTTDPAAHIAATVGQSMERLTVSRIDPEKETREYTESVMAKSSPELDAHGRALLEEDLRSPCTEEIAVFSAFANTIAKGEAGFVVLDTAPTGHTILLLDAAQAYHREVTRNANDVPEAVVKLLSRLRDPGFTRILLVTLPEATPVHEAAKLQDDLERAGIEPFAWIVNQSFAGDRFRDPVLIERGLREGQYISEVRDQRAKRFAVVPWTSIPLTGIAALRQLTSVRSDQRELITR
jgi:arsenite/tail-anchored protein-transporting ATPase